MAALIPALIKMFMSRARGGGGGGGSGGGGGGMPKPQKSAADKDDDYWAKAGMSNDSSESALTAAIKAQPKLMTWDEAVAGAKRQ
jgi:hypothetical protein